MVNHARVLLIEDQADLAANLFEYLEARGFIMDAAPDGVSGLALATDQDFDAIVLDLMLPGLDGLEVCERLRSQAGKDTPIIMLTARDTLDDKLAGFAVGTDDYLIKPFDLPELEARLQALITRARAGFQTQLSVGPLTYDTTTLTIIREGQNIQLNPACRTILEMLMRASPKAVSRERLERALWGDDPPDSDSLRSHIYALRKAVDGPFPSPLLHTVHRYGYRLCDKAPSD